MNIHQYATTKASLKEKLRKKNILFCHTNFVRQGGGQWSCATHDSGIMICPGHGIHKASHHTTHVHVPWKVLSMPKSRGWDVSGTHPGHSRLSQHIVCCLSILRLRGPDLDLMFSVFWWLHQMSTSHIGIGTWETFKATLPIPSPSPRITANSKHESRNFKLWKSTFQES